MKNDEHQLSVKIAYFFLGRVLQGQRRGALLIRKLTTCETYRLELCGRGGARDVVSRRPLAVNVCTVSRARLAGLSSGRQPPQKRFFCVDC
ncbi:MAG: hypothetical protein L7W43_15975, partial [Rubripirellula sp.]|nr:hypothetical protein [Rubripirellula sp.]